MYRRAGWQQGEHGSGRGVQLAWGVFMVGLLAACGPRVRAPAASDAPARASNGGAPRAASALPGPGSSVPPSSESAPPLKGADRDPTHALEGEASWYGASLAGRRTASGERFDPQAWTAAHRSLPFGTWVEVVRVDTGRSVRVRINDRGPFAAGRVIDLSQRAAAHLDMLQRGVARVRISVVSSPR